MSAVLQSTRSPAILHPDTVDWRARRPAPDEPDPSRSHREPDPARPSQDQARLIPDPAGPTLEDVVARAWEVLGTELPAACPVCGGELVPHPPTAGGRCESCGSTLT